MNFTSFKKAAFVFALLLAMPDFAVAQNLNRTRQTAAATNPRRASAQSSAAARIEERNVRAQMDFLAGDAMQGRGSGTQFELLAGQYIASQLQQFGVEPAGETDASGEKTYIQTVSITRNAFAENPTLTYAGAAGGAPVSLEHGKEMIVYQISAGSVRGALQKMSLNDKPKAGAIVFFNSRATSDNNKSAQEAIAAGAAAVLVEETTQWRARWNNFAARKPSFTRISGSAANSGNLIFISTDAANRLAQISEGTQIEIKGTLAAPEAKQTWNAVGKITGSDARLAAEVILLSAHMDHLGVRANAPGADKIYNGADDDASGCVAVLELARVLAKGRRPKRTVYFAFFGSEEAGGYGSKYFAGNLQFPKDKLVANLQFEMIGRPDAKVKAEELWLTGYERSNLGSELAKRGAKLVGDPHPEQNFFQRSDNYTLARQGIIAHTVSSFGLHTDYHQPTDEPRTIDFVHMTRAINSMVKPVEWLVNSNFKPVWFEGKKP